MKAKLKRLHPQDNIVVATGPIKEGAVLKLDKVKLQVVNNVPLAGKVATRPIAEGEKIIKFGQPIGHATTNIEPGEWVHTHNLASDYLPTPERTPKPVVGSLAVEAEEIAEATPLAAAPTEEPAPTEVATRTGEETPPPSEMGAPAGEVPLEVPQGQETPLTQEQPTEAIVAAVQELPSAEDTAAAQATAPPEEKPPIEATTSVSETPPIPAGETPSIAETLPAQVAGPETLPPPAEQASPGPETPSISEAASTGAVVLGSESPPQAVQPSEDSSSAAASEENKPSGTDNGASSTASRPEAGTS